MMKYFLLLVLFCAPLGASAATLELRLPHDTVRVGDSATVELALDAEGKSLNAVEGSLSFSSNLALIGVRTDDSAVPLWVEEPHLTRGHVQFAGVIPTGYDGSVSAEWDGVRPGTVLTLVFEVLRPGASSVTLDSGSAYLNDGHGTLAPLTIVNVAFPALQESGLAHNPAVTTRSWFILLGMLVLLAGIAWVLRRHASS